LFYVPALGAAGGPGPAAPPRRGAARRARGAWSYEVIDAKLATETRAGTILQLCVYSELVAGRQGKWPDHAHVVAPHHGFAPEPHRLADYAAYYRLVRRRLEEAIALEAAATYPEPVMHCEVCAWWEPCNARRRADDHLCFVAGISRLRFVLCGDNVAALGRHGEIKPWKGFQMFSRTAIGGMASTK
jgi:predicted RecB family nuclease